MKSATVEPDLKKIPREKNIYYPQNVEDIQEIIQFALQNHYLVRTVGSEHWSYETLNF